MLCDQLGSWMVRALVAGSLLRATIDLTSISNADGTEVAGVLGFAMLFLLDRKQSAVMEAEAGDGAARKTGISNTREEERYCCGKRIGFFRLYDIVQIGRIARKRTR
jgi:hypothetical protein